MRAHLLVVCLSAAPLLSCAASPSDTGGGTASTGTPSSGASGQSSGAETSPASGTGTSGQDSGQGALPSASGAGRSDSGGGGAGPGAEAGGGTAGTDASTPGAASGENSTTGCSVPPMPAFAALTTDAKLPDPFTSMDGTRISQKSQWTCRRAEISAEAQQFEFGTKPPPPASVTGSTSGNSIVVNVSSG